MSDHKPLRLKGYRFCLPHDKQFLYARATLDGNRRQHSIATFNVKNGKSLINNAPINGKTTELKVDRTDNFLAAANMVKAMYRYGAWKGVYHGELVQELPGEKIPCRTLQPR